jgi:hypothetical protein
MSNDHVSIEQGLAALLNRQAKVDLADPKAGINGLAQLVLTLIKVVHELLEKQAIRRFEAGSLNDAEAEELGSVLMAQARELKKLCVHFGLDERDLTLDLGPLGKL